MPIDVTVNGLSGASPFDIYLCDDPITTCVYVATITSTPYTFEVPLIFIDKISFNLKVIDNNNCEVTQTITYIYNY